jgi:hypothetical protein
MFLLIPSPRPLLQIHLANNWGNGNRVVGASGSSGSSGAIFSDQALVEVCTLREFQRHARQRNSRLFLKAYDRSVPVRPSADGMRERCHFL